MARMRHLFGLMALSLSLTGCVAQEKYNALKMANDKSEEQIAEDDRNLASLQAENESLKSQLAMFKNGGDSSNALSDNLRTQNEELQRQLDDLRHRYDDAMARVGSMSSPLPADVSSALSELANQYPDVLEFDASRGMLKFKSDVTFALGDASLTPQAKAVISKVAMILNSPAAEGYELLVAGHTDSTPVSNRLTIAKGHKDNWYLSAHRAIGVGEEMIRDGVQAGRVGCVGYAEQRPVASNSTESGKAQNRRVEVLVLPSSARASTPTVTSVTPDTSIRRAAPKPMMNKDSFNKDAAAR